MEEPQSLFLLSCVFVCLCASCVVLCALVSHSTDDGQVNRDECFPKVTEILWNWWDWTGLEDFT